MATAKKTPKRTAARSKAEKAGDHIAWKRVDPKIWTAVANIVIETMFGRTATVPTQLRIDARGVRVRFDRGDHIAGAWEAADGGGFATVPEAKAHAAKWLKAARKQHTLTPRISKD
jgi:hypothetical protein